MQVFQKLKRSLVVATRLISGALIASSFAVGIAHAQSAGKIMYVTRLIEDPKASERHREIQKAGLAMDAKVKAYLERKGFSVKLFDQTVSPTESKGFDLVIISSVVQSREMADTDFKNVPIPLLTWENDLFDSLRLTGQEKHVVYGEVEKEHYIRIINAPHPMAGGLPAGKTYVYPRDVTMGWGTPARGAIVIATLPGDLDKAVVFGYEKGATMDYDFIAPARRVALFLDNQTFDYLSPQGVTLFDSALKWIVSKP